MKKRHIAGGLAAGFIVYSAIIGATFGGSDSSNSPTSNINKTVEHKSASQAVTEKVSQPKTELICDGKTITSDCSVGKVKYSTYIYHPAVAEVSHEETKTTYSKQVSGYCTLCVDGSYSPTCATGRGACSHHGGVAQWNAPRYSSVPKEVTKKVVDSPAQKAYYEKLVSK